MAPTGKLPRLTLSGTPYELGFAHGSLARAQVHRTLAFYATLFQATTGKSWPEVVALAARFVPFIRTNLPDLLDEMQGVADGAQRSLLDVVAVNVRTEINFGLFSDGCTALAWYQEEGGKSVLAQNWDWMEAQKGVLVLLEIEGRGKPAIKMVTEAGLVGKIGFNENGVGVCLNAIRKKGMDVDKVPCHLALRVVLEAGSKEQAMQRLEQLGGVASACHMLVADGDGSVGLEWSSETGRRLGMDEKGRLFHTNHYLREDMKKGDTMWLKDSTFRVRRIEELCDQLKEPTLDVVQGLFTDETNYPGAICRKQDGESTSATLFNIVMDLRQKKAKVIFGRPVAPEDELELSF